jgi:cell wall-associated NlpC family hydrolase
MKELLSGKTRNRIKLMAAAVAALMFALLLAPVSAVLAVPPSGDIGTMSQQAAQVTQEINALDQQLGAATEAYNRVKSELDAITEKVDETRQRLYEIKQSLKERRDLLNSRAVSMYKNGRTSILEVLLDTRDFADFLERADYVVRVTESDSKLIKRIRLTRDSVAEMERQVSEQQRQQQGLFEQAEAQKGQIEAKLAERQAYLNSLNQEIQRQLAEQARQSAAESAALEQQAKQGLLDAPEAGLAKTALKYLGVPYHWAGAGPGRCPTGEHRICFDCSGLTMYVYELFGISLPHNAAMQFNRGIKIPLSQARPGDLVFFGMPPHHVGMYLGNDMFVEAPHTGDIVKVSRLSNRSDLSGICRFGKTSD